MKEPQTLLEAIQYFSDADRCIAYMVQQRWPDGVVICPTCGRNDVSWLANQKKWQCKSQHKKRQFSAKVGTIFEDSAIPLEKWLMAAWMLTNCRNGISSYELARDIGVTQKSSWFMLHRLRLAMREDDSKLGGPDGGAVEVDETFVGGNPKNWHHSRREKMRSEVRSKRVQKVKNAYTHKTAVVGMLDRESRKVRAKVVPNVRRETLQKEILETIEFGSKVYTDQAVTYTSLKDKYVHETVNHAIQYVNGQPILLRFTNTATSHYRPIGWALPCHGLDRVIAYC